MAIIKLGVTITGVRGTIGGVTFSQNRAGPFARLWSKSSNPLSQKQTAQRAIVASMPTNWRTLTPVQQAAWDTWAALPAQEKFNRLGDSFFASGFQWYVEINTRLTIVGRAIRIAPPITAVPAAPAIAALQLPFLPGQIAKIVYAAGVPFTDHDVIVFLSQSSSFGRQVRPAVPSLMASRQVPNFDALSFLSGWLSKYGFAADTSKGFAEVHVQTTDGQRSAPTSLSFIASDSAPYSTTALEYNGTTQYATRAAALSGAADSKLFTFAFWIRHNTASGSTSLLTNTAGNRFFSFLDSLDRFGIILRDSSGTQIADIRTPALFPDDSTWHSVIVSGDTETEAYNFVVDGFPVATTLISGTPNLAVNFSAAQWSMMATFAGGSLLAACISEVFLDTTSALDIADPSNIAAFISPEGAPMELGSAGQFPTAVQPILYSPGGDPSTNLGSGGVFSLVGAPGACGTAPS